MALLFFVARCVMIALVIALFLLLGVTIYMVFVDVYRREKRYRRK